MEYNGRSTGQKCSDNHHMKSKICLQHCPQDSEKVNFLTDFTSFDDNWSHLCIPFSGTQIVSSVNSPPVGAITDGCFTDSFTNHGYIEIKVSGRKSAILRLFFADYALLT